jgi:uroporphyrinogen decarboxylase
LEPGKGNLEARKLIMFSSPFPGKFSKRRRLEEAISGGKTDRPPVALWRHFPVDDQTPDGLAEATFNFQKEFDFDFIKVTPTSSFCLRDWGASDVWRGATEGTRDYQNRVIQKAQDWERLTVLDPNQGYLGDQLTCLRLLSSSAGEEIPFIQTIFSPLAQAKNLVGGNQLIHQLRQYPQEVHAGLKIITESTIRFIEAAIGTGISGVFYAVQQASYSLLSEVEFMAFGRQYDLVVLEAVSSLWLNILHLHGEQVMFDQVSDYPVGVINWHDRETEPDLAAAKKRFQGAVCGGLEREHTMVLGSPVQVTAQARDAIQATEGQRFFLGTGCVLPITAPRGNILAARRSVEL